MYDLPCDDSEAPGLPDEFHLRQPQLLRETFRPAHYPPERVFEASDMNLYYDVRHPLWYKGPDWFAVLGVSSLYEGRDMRRSYVIWQEGVAPYLVVELLSPGTEDEDLGREASDDEPPAKWTVYERLLRIPYYVVFSGHTGELHGFRLEGEQYQEAPFANRRLWLPEAGLGLGLWSGVYHGLERHWLRFCGGDGRWLLTFGEEERQRAEQEHRRAEQEHQRAEQERRRADRLAARLRALGIDPESDDRPG